jgi:hypothetical protein
LRYQKWGSYLNTAAQKSIIMIVQTQSIPIRENGSAKWLVCLASEKPDPKWRDWSSGCHYYIVNGNDLQLTTKKASFY